MSATRKPNADVTVAKAGRTTKSKPKSVGYAAKRQALSARVKVLRDESEALSISAGRLLDRLTN
jgi:hypothetical protein